MIFASTLFSRAVDPVIPKIAADLAIDVKTAALLSSAFTFPYAIMQPALGTVGDFFGKTRLMNISLAAVVTTTLICAFASNFYGAGDHARHRRRLRRRHLSGRRGDRRRSRAGAFAPGRDRPAAWRWD